MLGNYQACNDMQLPFARPSTVHAIVLLHAQRHAAKRHWFWTGLSMACKDVSAHDTAYSVQAHACASRIATGLSMACKDVNAHDTAYSVQAHACASSIA